MTQPNTPEANKSHEFFNILLVLLRHEGWCSDACLGK